MERLTEWGTRGVAFIKNLRPCGIPNDCNDLIYEVTKKCAAYENTGLSPEEVKRVKETLITVQRLKKEQYDTLEKYLKAEAEGRLVILPCKAGTPLWRVFNGAVEKYFVVSVNSKTHINRRTLIECMPFMRFYWEDEVDKTIFLTKEEAESALKGAANAD